MLLRRLALITEHAPHQSIHPALDDEPLHPLSHPLAAYLALLCACWSHTHLLRRMVQKVERASEPITAAPLIAHIVRSRHSKGRVGHLRQRASLVFVVAVGGALPGKGGGMRRGCLGIRVVVVVAFAVVGVFVVVVSVLAKDDVAVAAEIDDAAAVAGCCCWIVRARPLTRDQSRLPQRAFRAIAIRIGIIIYTAIITSTITSTITINTIPSKIIRPLPVPAASLGGGMRKICSGKARCCCWVCWFICCCWCFCCCYWRVVVVVIVIVVCELGRASRRRNPTIPAPEPSSTLIIATASDVRPPQRSESWSPAAEGRVCICCC